MGDAGAIVTGAWEAVAEKVEILGAGGVGIIHRSAEFGTAVGQALDNPVSC